MTSPISFVGSNERARKTRERTGERRQNRAADTTSATATTVAKATKEKIQKKQWWSRLVCLLFVYLDQ